MKPKFPYAELLKVARQLAGYTIPDFQESALPQAESLSAVGAAYLKGYGPFLDAHLEPEFDRLGTPAHYRDSIRLIVAHAIQQTFRTTSQAEATTAGVALPTFTRQKIATILKAYPQSMFMELFGVFPMPNPTARCFFKVFQYADAYLATAPNIAVGDDTADLTKMNEGYADANEGDSGNEFTMLRKFLDVSETSKRLLGTWSDNYEDDSENVFGEDARADHLNHASKYMAWALSRTAIKAAIAAVPAANTFTWDATPAANPNYDTLTPDQQRAFDEFLYTRAIVPCVEGIRKTNAFNPEAEPNWMLVGPNGAKLIRQIRGFTSRDNNATSIAVQTGQLRDMGAIQDYGLRVFVDPQLDGTSTTTATILIGRRPEAPEEPGVRVGIYVPLKVLKEVYNPKIGETTGGVRTRYAILKPNTGAEPLSSRLGDVYGRITVTL